MGVPNENGFTTAWLMVVFWLVALALKEKEVLPVVLVPKAGGGAMALLDAFEAPPKLNADCGAAAGAGAVEFDPAEKLKLLDLRGLAAEAEELLLLVLAVPIPPKAKGLLVAGAGAAVVEPPNENGAEVGEVTLD